MLAAIRRIKRMYQLRDTQINRVTSYDHLGIIGISHCGNGDVLPLKSPWHSQSKDMSSNRSMPCSYVDRTTMNLSEIDEFLTKIESIDQTNEFVQLKTNKNKKLSRRIRDLDKAFQVLALTKKIDFCLKYDRI
mgnify:FL=1